MGPSHDKCVPEGCNRAFTGMFTLMSSGKQLYAADFQSKKNMYGFIHSFNKKKPLIALLHLLIDLRKISLSGCT